MTLPGLESSGGKTQTEKANTVNQGIRLFKTFILHKIRLQIVSSDQKE